MAHVKVRLLALDVAGVDKSADVSSAVINSAEADGGFQSLAAVRAGGARDYSLALTIAQDHASGSLYSQILDNPGTEVAVIYTPYFGSAIGADTPVYNCTAIIMEPDGAFMGGEASSNPGTVATVDVEWPLTGRPVPDIAP